MSASDPSIPADPLTGADYPDDAALSDHSKVLEIENKALNQFEDDVRDVMDFMTDEAAKEDLNNALARLMDTRTAK